MTTVYVVTHFYRSGFVCRLKYEVRQKKKNMKCINNGLLKDYRALSRLLDIFCLARNYMVYNVTSLYAFI